MRIVAGSWKGRPLDAPAGRETRPTSDRVREALFSALVSLLGEDLGGCAVLDPFAGSGALGLEALSRGASRVTFAESAAAAARVVRANAAALGAADRVRVVRGDAFRLARSGALAPGPFGLLLLDPPYRIGAAQVAHLLADAAAAGLLADGAAVVWEHAAGSTVEWPEGFEPARSKRYGSTAVDIATYRGGRGPE